MRLIMLFCVRCSAHELPARLAATLTGLTMLPRFALAQSHAHPRLPFFASPLRLGREGVESILPLGRLNAYEEEGMQVRPDVSADAF